VGRVFKTSVVQIRYPFGFQPPGPIGYIQSRFRDWKLTSKSLKPRPFFSEGRFPPSGCKFQPAEKKIRHPIRAFGLFATYWQPSFFFFLELFSRIARTRAEASSSFCLGWGLHLLSTPFFFFPPPAGSLAFFRPVLVWSVRDPPLAVQMHCQTPKRGFQWPEAGGGRIFPFLTLRAAFGLWPCHGCLGRAMAPLCGSWPFRNFCYGMGNSLSSWEAPRGAC